MGLLRVQRYSQQEIAPAYVLTQMNRTIPLDPDRPLGRLIDEKCCKSDVLFCANAR